MYIYIYIYVGKKLARSVILNTVTTFITEACQETFKIQKGPLNCDSEKVLAIATYYLCRVCGEVSYVGKAKTKFRYSFNNYKSKHIAFRKGNQLSLVFQIILSDCHHGSDTCLMLLHDII